MSAEKEAFVKLSLEKANATLKARVKTLMDENLHLKENKDKHENDAHEFATYFQHELEKKDKMIKDLTAELRQLKHSTESQSIEQKKTYENTIGDLEQKYGTQVKSLQINLTNAEGELDLLNEFRVHKDIVETKLKETQHELSKQHEQQEVAMELMERKLVEERAQMKREMQRRMEQLKDRFREEARQEMSVETKRIEADNLRMGEELRFQLEASNELQKENARIENENHEFARELTLQLEKEKLYAQQGYRKSKDVKELTSKARNLEKQLTQIVRDYEKQMEGTALKHKKELEAKDLEHQSLKQLVKLRSKELRAIRRHAQVLLDGRNEIQEFFLQALETVKREMTNKKLAHAQSKQTTYRNQMREATLKGTTRFPTIKHPTQMAASSILPEPSKLNNIQKIDIGELNWEDKERVLRLLFAKINGFNSAVDMGNTAPVDLPPVGNSARSLGSLQEDSHESGGMVTFTTQPGII
eukprot:TRINITY_DN41853_c0_g1_i1.p1 TRINITY_DN41853_c0_g1~~TRINITY_DN41853_c0_g1_i1.p1  ORF type:complete len:474 (+),score=138.74 TRINITY_DN41853_c0_g1_i1:65-1486(+)